MPLDVGGFHPIFALSLARSCAEKLQVGGTANSNHSPYPALSTGRCLSLSSLSEIDVSQQQQQQQQQQQTPNESVIPLGLCARDLLADELAVDGDSGR